MSELLIIQHRSSKPKNRDDDDYCDANISHSLGSGVEASLRGQ